MLVDISLISPVKEGASAEGVKRRQKDRERSQKVLPRRQVSAPLNQDESAKPQGRALNAYA